MMEISSPLLAPDAAETQASPRSVARLYSDPSDVLPPLFTDPSVSEPALNQSLDEFLAESREDVIPETIIYVILWVLGTVGNLFVLHQLHTCRTFKAKTHFLIKHLAVADLIVIWLTISIEIAWRISIAWYTNDVWCRIIQIMRSFGLYLTSMIVVCITVDRFYAFVYPMSIFNSKSRNKKFLIFSYVFSLTVSIPNVSIVPFCMFRWSLRLSSRLIH